MSWHIFSLRAWILRIRQQLGVVSRRRSAKTKKTDGKPPVLRPQLRVLEDRTSFNDVSVTGLILAATGGAAGLLAHAIFAPRTPGFDDVASVSLAGSGSAAPFDGEEARQSVLWAVPANGPVVEDLVVSQDEATSQQLSAQFAQLDEFWAGDNQEATRGGGPGMSGGGAGSGDSGGEPGAGGLAGTSPTSGGNVGGDGSFGPPSASDPFGGPADSGSPMTTVGASPIIPTNAGPTPPLDSGAAANSTSTDTASSPLPALSPHIPARVTAFEPNVGQVADSRQQFLAHGAHSTLFLSAESATILLQPDISSTQDVAGLSSGPQPAALTLQFVGANASAQAVGSGLLPGITNYFIGDDPTKWRTDIPNYSQVTFAGVYDGIDLVYHGGGGSTPLEYDWSVAPGADVAQIRVSLVGANDVWLDGQGNLFASTAAGVIEQKAPVLFQEIDGARQAVDGRFVLHANDEVGIEVGAFDTSRPLVIDPVITYSTYLGGNADDYATGIATDASGNAYVTGTTYSTTFPTTSGAYSSTKGGAGSSPNAFVSKFNSSGTLQYSTYVGGSWDRGRGIAVDGSGNAYVTGDTYGSFPTTSNAYQTTNTGGVSAAFVFKLNSSGNSLLYGTYLVGSASDSGGGAIAVDSGGKIYVAGQTRASNFPTANAVQATFGGNFDAFLSRLDVGVSSTTLDFSTYLGGSDIEFFGGLAVTTSGSTANVYVSGQTYSTNFPTAAPVGSSAAQSVSGGNRDAFVSRYEFTAPSTLSLKYSSYLGGSGGEHAMGIAVDSSGRAYLGGMTGSTNLPTTSNALQSSMGGPLPPGDSWGGDDAFVARINDVGTQFDYVSYLGGSESDQGLGVALDSSNNVYVFGRTASEDFPTASPNQSALSNPGSGLNDAFLSKLIWDGTASSLIYSSYLGGSGEDYANGIALDSSGNPVLAGQTNSSDFPNAASSGRGLLLDGFVTSLGSLPTSANTVTISTPTSNASEAGPTAGAFSISRTGDTSTAMNVYYTVSGTATKATDYNTLTGTAVIAAGQSSVTVPVVPIGDSLVEGNETVIVTLSAYRGYTLGGTTSGTVTIADSDTYAYVTTSDPLDSMPLPTNDSVNAALLYLLNGSVKTQVEVGSVECGCNEGLRIVGRTALVHDTSSVSARPILVGTFASDAGKTLSALETRLTWNGSAQSWVSFGLSGHSPGDIYLLNSQVGSAVTSTGAYAWQIEVKATYTDTSVTNRTVSGVAPIVINDTASNPFGAGWSLSILDYLVVGGSGVQLVYGTGGSRYFAGTTTFTSPANDLGTLVKNGDNSYTYTDKYQTKKNFDSSGKLTSAVDSRGVAVTYSYSSGRLSTVQMPDGRFTTFTYNADANPKLISITAPGSRTFTLSRNGSGDLTSVTQPDGALHTFTYDASKRITNDKHGQLNVTYTYDGTNGTVTQVDRGSSSTLAVVAANVQGLATSPAKSVTSNVAVLTDALSQVTTQTFDAQGRLTKLQTPDGATQTWILDHAGDVIKYTDALSRVTTSIYNASQDLIQRTRPDGSNEYFQYESTFHNVTRAQDGLNRISRFTYSPTTGELLTERNALNQVTSYTYSNGLLSTVTDPLGRTATYLYGSLRELTTTIDALGNRTTLTYDSVGNMETVKDALGRVTTSAYDGMRRLTKTTDAAGGVVTMQYDAIGNMTGYIDQLGHATSYVFDSRGWQTAVIEAVGTGVQRTTTTAYDVLGRVTAVTDALNHTSSYTYDAVGRLKTIKAPDNTVTTSSYDLAGQLTTVTDALGRVTTMAYNNRSRQTKLTDALGQVTTTSYDVEGNTTVIQDANGNRTTYTLDSLNRVTVVQDAVSNRTTTTFDAAGNLLSVKNPRGFTTSYAYDALNRQTRVIEAHGQTEQRTTTTVYDAVSNVLSVTNPRGFTTSYAFDSLNRQTRVIEALGQSIERTTTTVYDAASNVLSVTNPRGFTTSIAYDSLNQQTRVIEALGQSIERTTTTVYDAGGNVLSMTNPRGFTTSYALDSRDRVTRVIEALGQSIERTTTTVYDAVSNVLSVTDPRGLVTSLAYDAINQGTKVTDSLGNVTTTAYDKVGNVTKTIDALGNTTTYVFDGINRQTAVQTPTGGFTTTSYDGNGNVTQVVQLLATSPSTALATTTYNFDALDRQTKSTDARGGVTTILYDATDNTTGIIDSVGNRTTMQYDALDRQTSETDPLNKTMTYAFDAASNLTSKTDRLGRRMDYAFDALNRNTTVTWYNAGGGSPVNTLTYSFDPTNKLLTAGSTQGGTYLYTMTYDALDRTSVVKEPFGLTLTYSYDANDNRTLVQDSLNGVLTSVYDNADRLATQLYGGSGQTPLRVDMSYTNRHELSTVTRYSDLSATTKVGSSTYTYDAGGRLDKLQHRNGAGTLISNYTYTYDKADRVTTEVFNGTTTTFQYDSTDQLTNDSTTTFTYDANGNRNMSGWVTGPGNRLLSDGTYTYTYDDEGNRIERKKLDGTDIWTYVYDHRNQLVSASHKATSGGSVDLAVTHTYAVFNNRIQKDADPDGAGGTGVTTERYAYDGMHIWADLNGGSSLTMRRLYLDGQVTPWARISSGGTAAHYLADRLGSVRDNVDASGALANHTEFDGFGKVKSQTNAGAADRFLYTGQERDSETGLQRNLHRWLDSWTGRWLQEDPIRFRAGDTNVNRYGENNPTNFLDPSGLSVIGKAAKAVGKETAWEVMKRRLRQRLGKRMAQVHHLIPQKFFEKNQFGPFLKKLGIDRDDFKNIVPLPTKKGKYASLGLDRSLHQGGHVSKYFDDIANALTNIRKELNCGSITMDEAKQAVRVLQENLKTGLKNGTIPLHRKETTELILPLVLAGSTAAEQEAIANDIADRYAAAMDKVMAGHLMNIGRAQNYTGKEGAGGWFGWTVDLFNPLDDLASIWDIFVFLDYDPETQSPEEFLSGQRPPRPSNGPGELTPVQDVWDSGRSRVPEPKLGKRDGLGDR